MVGIRIKMTNIEKVTEYLQTHKKISKTISEEKLKVENLVQIIYVLRKKKYSIFTSYKDGRKKEPIYILMKKHPTK